MNCFLFYFQQPIKSQPLIIKCPINAKYHSSGQQSIPNHKDGITVNRLKKYFLILSCIHKTVTEKINNKIHMLPQNKAKFLYQNDNLAENA